MVVGKAYKRHVFTWEIKDFSTVTSKVEKEGFILSPVFSTVIDNKLTKWQMKFYPHGDAKAENNAASLFVTFTNDDDTSVRVFIKFMPMKNEEVVFSKTTESKDFTKDNCTSGFSTFMGQSYLKPGYNSNVVVNDCLKLVCEIIPKNIIVTEMGLPETALSLRLQECDKYKALLDDSKHTDVTINVGDKQLRAHKAILAAKSSVFAAMFNSDMLESNNSSVNIVDYSYEAVKEMLTFMYTGMLQFVDDEKDSKLLPLRLLVAADKYDLPGLKLLCEKKLGDNLTSNNVISLLEFADKCNANNLKDRAVNYIVENAHDIVHGEKFQKYGEDHADIVCQILRMVCFKRIKRQ